jgi:hypothetical protein
MLKVGRTSVVVAASFVLSLFVAAIGCRPDSPPQMTAPTDTAGPTTRPLMASLFGPAEKKGGAQLWAENCNRCHYAPPPDRFSDAQWEVIVDHMRLRANLTGQEARQIAEFLKASN